MRALVVLTLIASLIGLPRLAVAGGGAGCCGAGEAACCEAEANPRCSPYCTNQATTQEDGSRGPCPDDCSQLPCCAPAPCIPPAVVGLDAAPLPAVPASFPDTGRPSSPPPAEVFRPPRAA